MAGPPQPIHNPQRTALPVKEQDDKDLGLIHAALFGERGDDQKRIVEQVVKWGAMILRKNHDYGSSVWKVPKLAPTCDIGTAILVRMSDKIERIESLDLKGGKNEVEDEKVEDTISDLGAYCLLYLARPKSGR